MDRDLVFEESNGELFSKCKKLCVEELEKPESQFIPKIFHDRMRELFLNSDSSFAAAAVDFFVGLPIYECRKSN